jgi:2-polyprenyl-3-methyl-5-hydroxy-6-metoxy-1,4-benzoquinol methylase
MRANRAMRILVCIANYGVKNDVYLKAVLNEYRRMPFEVKIVVVSDRPRQLGADVEVQVGLPSKNPYSLPFAHKKVFADRVDEYDLFIYSEDDMLVTETNINTFLKLTGCLPENAIFGFLRYEVDAYGKRYFPDAHRRFHWVLNSVERHGGEIFARYKNDHSAVYMLTKNQLRTAIDSGGFLVSPHEGDYDMRESAATDPYTQCGFRRLLCISHLSDILIHHMPNVYIGKIGIEFEEFEKQIEALLTLSNSNYELFDTCKKLNVPYWDKWFYEDTDPIIVEALTGPNKRVLSIGAGWGRLEEDVKRMGHFVLAVPIDNVIAASLRYRGIDVVEPNLQSALNQLRGSTFDCLILSNVLQHLNDPQESLRRFTELVGHDGIIIAKIPNFNFFRYKSNGQVSRTDSKFKSIHIQELRQWFDSMGFKAKIIATGSERVNCLYRLAGPILASRLARSFVLIASRAGAALGL